MAIDVKGLRFVGVVAAVAVVSSLAACGGGSGDESAEATVTIAPHAAPREVAGVAGLEGVHSGQVEADLIVTKLKKKETISLRLTGGFKGLGEEPLPQFSMAASSQGRWNGRSVNFNSLLTVLPEEAALRYEAGEGEKSYEIESSTLDELRSKIEQAQSEGGKGDVAACLGAARGFDFAQLIRDPEIEGRRKESDGTKVVVIGGHIDISRLRGLLVGLAQDPDCAAQMEALGLPPAAQLEASRVDFKKGFGPRLTLTVDRHGVVRSLSTRFECARLNGEFFELELNFSLREVNRASEIIGAAGAEPLDSLLRELGTTQEAALQAEGEEVVIALVEGLGGSLVGRLP